MQVRREQALTCAEIGKVVAAAVDRFRDDAELAVANIRPNVPLAFPCEPIDAAARMRGLAACWVTYSYIKHNDVGAISDLTRTCAQAALDRDALPDSLGFVRKLTIFLYHRAVQWCSCIRRGTWHG